MKTMEHPVPSSSRPLLLLILAVLYALAPAAFGQMGTTPRIVPNLFTSSYKSYFEDFDYPGFNYGTTNYVDYSLTDQMPPAS